MEPIFYYRNKNINDMTKKELIELLKKLYERLLNTIAEADRQLDVLSIRRKSKKVA
jgi:flagellin-specific chaperone FliS